MINARNWQSPIFQEKSGFAPNCPNVPKNAQKWGFFKFSRKRVIGFFWKRSRILPQSLSNSSRKPHVQKKSGSRDIAQNVFSGHARGGDKFWPKNHFFEFSQKTALRIFLIFCMELDITKDYKLTQTPFSGRSWLGVMGPKRGQKRLKYDPSNFNSNLGHFPGQMVKKGD